MLPLNHPLSHHLTPVTTLPHSITGTTVQYVRCIKPNSIKSALHFDRKMVVEQLRCAGNDTPTVYSSLPNTPAHFFYYCLSMLHILSILFLILPINQSINQSITHSINLPNLLGMIDAIRISRSAYPYRVTHAGVNTSSPPPPLPHPFTYLLIPFLVYHKSCHPPSHSLINTVISYPHCHLVSTMSFPLFIM